MADDEIAQGALIVGAEGAPMGTLAELLQKHERVLLYFAAKWCPDCVDFAPKLNRLNLPLVLVSSDNTAEEMENHIKTLLPERALALEFGQSAINALKRKYGACAKREVATAGVKDRKSGIPALVSLPDGSFYKL